MPCPGLQRVLALVFVAELFYGHSMTVTRQKSAGTSSIVASDGEVGAQDSSALSSELELDQILMAPYMFTGGPYIPQKT